MSPMIPRSLCFVAVATVSLWAARAAAEQACPEGASPDETRDLAATAFEAGQRLYDQGNYRGAIERFRCSFRLVPHPNTLFNIGESAELAGDPALALQAFRQYLEQHPDGQGRDQAEARVRALEATSARAPEPETPEPETPNPAVAPEPEAAPGERRMTAARRAAWATLALGVAIGATGGRVAGPCQPNCLYEHTEAYINLHYAQFAGRFNTAYPRRLLHPPTPSESLASRFMLTLYFHSWQIPRHLHSHASRF